MRLLITFGYTKVLFAKGCDYSALIEACGSASIVEETGPYSSRVYTPQASGEIEVKLLGDDDIRLPDSDKPEVVTRLLEIAAERDTLKTKVYALEAQIKKLTDAVASATA